MPFIKSLISKVLNSGDQQPSDEADHYTQLEKLRSNHEWINVSISHSKQTYQSLILSIDVDQHELLIDDLYPPENTDQLQAGDTVEVFSQTRANAISFYTRILAQEEKADGSCWKLELPTEIGANHSRNAYRIYVESEQELDIEIYAHSETLQNVRIINLSAEGIKLSFDQNDEELLKEQHEFTDCIIRLPTGFDVDCNLDLRNTYSIRTPTPHILAGGKLTINNPQQRVKLQQYLASVQRQQRRREARIN